MTILVPRQNGGELINISVEFDVDRSNDVALEHNYQREAGQHQHETDYDRSCRQQADAERLDRHSLDLQVVALSAAGPDHIRPDLAAQSAKQNLEDIHLFVMVVTVEVVEQFDRAYHRTGAKRQTGEKPEFKRGEVNRRSIDSDDLTAA